MSQAVYLVPSARVTFDKKANFLEGEARSGVVNLRSFALRGFYVPATFLGTALTFFAAASPVSDPDDARLFPVVSDAGVVVTVTIAPSRYVVLGQANAELLNAVGDSLVIVSNVAQNVAPSIDLTLVGVASLK